MRKLVASKEVMELLKPSGLEELKQRIAEVGSRCPVCGETDPPSSTVPLSVRVHASPPPSLQLHVYVTHLACAPSIIETVSSEEFQSRMGTGLSASGSAVYRATTPPRAGFMWETEARFHDPSSSEPVDLEIARLLELGLHLVTDFWTFKEPAVGWSLVFERGQMSVHSPSELVAAFDPFLEKPPGWLEALENEGLCLLLSGKIFGPGEPEMNQLEDAVSAGLVVGGAAKVIISQR